MRKAHLHVEPKGYRQLDLPRDNRETQNIGGYMNQIEDQTLKITTLDQPKLENAQREAEGLEHLPFPTTTAAGARADVGNQPTYATTRRALVQLTLFPGSAPGGKFHQVNFATEGSMGEFSRRTAAVKLEDNGSG
jgi:hypothetical protein